MKSFMKPFLSLLTFAVLLTSCSKKIKQTVADPKAEAAFTRTVVYPNQNNSENKVSYSGHALVTPRAGIEGDLLYVGMYVMPVSPGTSGDGIWFKLDKRFLAQGLQQTYSVDGQTTPALRDTRYTHMVEKQEGGFWSSIHETSMGLKMEGTLTIAAYDAARKLVSGAFTVVIRDLINDPLKYNGYAQVDPINKNTVTITGTFRHVKLSDE